MTVLVAMPYRGAPHLLERAVRSVLDQRWRDLRLVVVGDGEEPPVAIADDRLLTYTLPEQRGCYFARQLMLEASPHSWHAPVDADDWIDPDHLSYLRSELRGTQAVVPRKVRGWIDERGPRVYGAGRYHVGLLGTDRLRAFGGYPPTERVGGDTLMLRLLALTGPVRDVTRPTYNRQRHPGSLTMDPLTAHRSKERSDAKRRNRATLAQALVLRDPAAIREYRATLVPAVLADELADHVDRLRHMLLVAARRAA